MAILDGHLLCAFVAFSEQRSFAGAARAIGLSQPALFERIARLARIVDLTLYERNGRTLTLTPHGDRLLAFAREELARAARFAGDDDAVDEVALAAGEGTYLYLLGPALARFTRAHQRQKLRALTLGLDDAVAALRDGTAHLAVAAVDVVPRGIDGIELVRSPLVVAVKKSHPWAHKRAISLAQLAREDLVLPPEGRSHRDVVGRALARRGLSLRTAAEADGWP
ncbi:MAG TPA: LysR family transcriptional regulator, partial [Myxococcota bacterium]